MYRQWGIPLFLVILVTCSLGIRYISLKQDLLNRHDLVFEASVSRYRQAIKQNLDAKIAAVNSLMGLFYASEFVSRKEFAFFSRSLLESHPEIQALEWLPVFSHLQRDHFVGLARDDGFSDYEILERNPLKTDELVKAEIREQYAPVFYLEPIDGNSRALGFDLYSDFKRQRAMKLAMHSKAVSFSEPVQLVQEKENQNAILVFAPVFKNSQNLENSEQRHENLQGFVLLVLRMDDFLNDTRDDFFLQSEIQYSLYDVSENQVLEIAGPNNSVVATADPFRLFEEGI